MSAKDDILQLLNRYAYTIDTGDLAGFASLYEQGEWYADGSPRHRGRDGVFDNVMSQVIIYDDGTPKTRHITANVELEIDEEAGTATGQRYVTVLQQTDVLPLQAIFSGHYFDEFVREDGQWRFAKTVIRYPLVGDMSAHLKGSVW